VARVGWCAWLLTFEQGSKEGVLLCSGTGKGDEAGDERSCEHDAIGRYVNSVRRGVVDSESGSSCSFEVAYGRTYVSSTGYHSLFPRGQVPTKPSCRAQHPTKHLLTTVTSLEALILIGRTSEMQIFIR
jgi:hypothetical protein